ncbi:twin-arginine translocation signal domain-containing protein [Sorangium sp. So ce693]|uniref:twin-arginine translocation signal domain-containing protein n=1 Tax=Sorangium sp. So ce693 TaxID=3133318 RepID=UPI003F5EEDE3
MRRIDKGNSFALSRRAFISATAAGVAGVVTGIEHEAGAQVAFTPRVSGLTLTEATIGHLKDAIRRGGYQMLKVVTGWGLLDRSIYDPATISELCSLTPITLVRTKTGDRYHVDPNEVEAEIAPWYAAKEKKRDLIIELGNEPNTVNDSDGTGAFWAGQSRAWKESYIWENRYYLAEAIARCRRRFPQAKIVTCSLAPRVNLDIEWFLQIYAQGTDSPLHNADYVAVHAYNGTRDGVDESWYRCQDLPLVHGLYGRYAPTKSWIMTEVGLHTDETRARKGERMAGFMHYGESSLVLPWNVWGFCYFHLKLDGNGNPFLGDRAAAYYGEGDSAYAQRVNAGRLRQTPVGWLDSIDPTTGVASGWAADPDTPASVAVHFYASGPGIDGIQFVGGTGADLPRLDVNTHLDMAGHHGFSFRIPDAWRNGTEYRLHAYGLDATGDLNTELSGSPKAFRL